MTTLSLDQTTNAADYLAAGGTRHDVANHRILSKLVEREVVQRASILISHFANHPESLEDSGYDYDSDLLPLLVRDDWDSPLDYHVSSMDRDEVVEILTDDFSIECGDDESIESLREALLVNIRDEEQQQEYCERFSLDPEQIEAYEHWIISSFFSNELAKHDEMVGELFDFTIWGRPTTGQAISMDGVIFSIAAEMQILTGQRYAWTE